MSFIERLLNKDIEYDNDDAFIVEQKELEEDTQVKFGGEVNGVTGWCVMLAGGPGAGKSTIVNYKIPINGKYVNLDEIKNKQKQLKHTIKTLIK